MDYIANSKNRKFKKQILIFLDRINFGAGKLPISGRIILILIGALLISLFFPWLHFEYLNKEYESYSAFSYFTGFIGYTILVTSIVIPFFLLSHGKKEKIRAHIPFRLSDTQLIVFVSSMLMTGMMHLFLMMPVFSQFATPTIGNGFLIAMSSVCCIIISAFFLSQKNKEESIELRHIDHREAHIPDEYATILGKKSKKEGNEDENMVLPI